MTLREYWNSLQGGGFIRGLADELLGWRSLFLGICGLVGGFGGAMNLDGIAKRLMFLAVGCVSLVLTVYSWRQVKRQTLEKNAQRRQQR
ncbi:hypothetical protein ACIHCX_34020 [Streptomyces sp. NPDC052043]|uniref:hypothetical protein n=1 Tax=Streptomyces sp. NPDC052043 TaxID=3365684 RepID=UPI0037D58D07